MSLIPRFRLGPYEMPTRSVLVEWQAGTVRPIATGWKDGPCMLDHDEHVAALFEAALR
jgi:hypothetical protein